MDYISFLKFFSFNSMFTFVIVGVSFILGWALYNLVILKNVNLRDALFERDNIAAWIEFIGAFIFPTLYLAATAIEGSASENIFLDLLICLGYAFIYIVIFTLLRLLSGSIVTVISPRDQQGKIDLNNEIYGQKNTAAALFSVVLSLIFVSFVKFLDLSPEFIVVSILRMLGVLLFTLLAIAVYSWILRRRTTLMKEIFVDNNIAAGGAFLGFIYAVEIILDNAVTLQKEFSLPDLLMVSAIGLIVFGIFSAIFKVIFSRIIRVDIWKEVYEQDSIGAAIGQSALYIGIANVIIHFIK